MNALNTQAYSMPERADGEVVDHAEELHHNPKSEGRLLASLRKFVEACLNASETNVRFAPVQLP
jgi:hypothetical protein